MSKRILNARNICYFGLDVRNVDFKDQQQNWDLCRRLALDLFDLRINAPEDSLCPTIPSRFDYVCFMRELEVYTKLTYLEEFGQEPVHGLDIGTGYSCIYGLLCAKQYRYKMTCTDISPESVDFASANVQQNGLNQLVNVILNQNEKKIINVEELTTKKFLFCMCNPPFYKTSDEIASSCAIKEKLTEPVGKISGKELEMFYENGAEGFIRNAIEESLERGNEIIWYTFLVFQKSTLDALMEVLQSHSDRIKCIFWQASQPAQTRRWFLAWSFRKFPSRNIFKTIKCQNSIFLNSNFLLATVISLLEDCQIFIQKTISIGYELNLIIVQLKENTWNRAFKRKKIANEIQKDVISFDAYLAIEASVLTMFAPRCHNDILFNSFYQMLFNRLTKE